MTGEQPHTGPGIPKGAKPKTLRRDSWDPSSTLTVYLVEVPSLHLKAFQVYLADGTNLGKAEAAIGSIDTKIPGTRLIRPGKRRQLWYPYGGYKFKRESAADAIRFMLADHEQDQKNR